MRKEGINRIGRNAPKGAASSTKKVVVTTELLHF